jgi:hypothetical protein
VSKLVVPVVGAVVVVDGVPGWAATGAAGGADWAGHGVLVVLAGLRRTPLTTAGAPGPGDLAVRDGAPGTPGSTELTTSAAFVILSHGENGLGAWLDGGHRMATTGIPAHEDENADGSPPFVDRPVSQVAGDVFDDMALWRDKPGLAQSAGAVFSGAICTAADGLWAANGCSLGSGIDECVTAGAIRARCG